MRNLPQSLMLLAILGILISFVGCSAKFEPSKLRYHSSGAAVGLASTNSQSVESMVLRPTTLYGLALIIIIVLIGVGLWLWEIHEERVDARPEEPKVKVIHRKK